MRRKAAVSLAVLGALVAMLTAPLRTSAEWVQNPIGVPRAPGCNPGYSWQKLGVRYQCATPPPSCQYGFASGPAWNGSGWIYSCNAPPPPPPVIQPPPQGGGDDPVEVAKANCAARALQDGITLGPLTNRIQYQSRGYSQWYYNESIGNKYWTKTDGSQSNVYEVVCTTVDSTGAWASVGGAGNYAVFMNQDCMIGGGACGG